jgi:hypothetical protein
LARGEFNVASKTPTTLDASGNFRVDADGDPTCIHPWKVGIPEGIYIVENASAAPEILAPEESDDIKLWILDVLRQTPPDEYESALDVLHSRATDAGIADTEFVAACRQAFGDLSQN